MLFLYRSIYRVFEIVCAFRWREEVEKVTYRQPSALDCSGLYVSHKVLELGEDLLGWVEIRAVGGQEDEVHSRPTDGLSVRLGPCSVDFTADPFTLEQVEEAFYYRVIMAVPRRLMDSSRLWCFRNEAHSMLGNCNP